jgi:predicted transcriptional regulator
MIETPHIGNILKEYVKEKRIFKAGWAKQMNISPSTIEKFVKSPNMKVDTLFKTCQVLNHNFLADIAAMLPQLPHANSNVNNTQIETLQKENETLKIQLATLKEALKLIGK